MQRFVAELPSSPCGNCRGEIVIHWRIRCSHLTGTNLERVAGAWSKLTTLERRILILDS